MRNDNSKPGKPGNMSFKNKLNLVLEGWGPDGWTDLTDTEKKQFTWVLMGLIAAPGSAAAEAMDLWIDECQTETGIEIVEEILGNVSVEVAYNTVGRSMGVLSNIANNIEKFVDKFQHYIPGNHQSFVPKALGGDRKSAKIVAKVIMQNAATDALGQFKGYMT